MSIEIAINIFMLCVGVALGVVLTLLWIWLDWDEG